LNHILILLLFLFSSIYLKASKSEDTLKILFIGNSYLNYFNVVDKFDSLATEAGKTFLIGKSIRNGMALPSHLDYSATLEKINENDWDYVFLQGSAIYMSKPKWHYLIQPYIIEFKDLIEETWPDSKTVYMMPWAYEDGLEWLPEEGDSYEEMQINLYHETIKFAEDNNIIVSPVGWAWYNVLQEKPELDIYMNDYSHPTNIGSYITACTIYSTIFVETTEEFEFIDTLQQEDAHLIQKVSSNVVLDSLDLWNIELTTSAINILGNESIFLENFPNPFSTYTTISFKITENNQLCLRIFDSLGKMVYTSPVRNYTAGKHILHFNGSDIKSGIYYSQLIIGQKTIKNIMLKLPK
jgi:Domain of unknown function (DUF4886)/Secretion system C-terminal sorting domain